MADLFWFSDEQWSRIEPLLPTDTRGMPPSKRMIADKGYDSAALREWLEERGAEPVVPPRANRKLQYAYDKALYRTRNVIERSFGRLKDYRRIATRFNKDVRNCFAALCIAVTVIWWV